METLYEINARYNAAIQMYEDGVSELVDTETGEIIPIENWLAALQMSKEEKIDNTIKYLKNCKAFCEAAKAEVEALEERIAKKAKKAEKLEKYLLSQLGDTKKIETPLYCLKVRTSKRTIAPKDEKAIRELPHEYWNEKTTVAADKKAIKKALESGVELAGCSIVENKTLSY